LDALKVIDVNSFLKKPLSCRCPKSIRAVCSQEFDLRTRPHGRNRLVRSLAASKHLKMPTEHCLPGIGQSITKDDQVGVRTPDY
jgi:hypothetical protein